jgi:hypothetical protein
MNGWIGRRRFLAMAAGAAGAAVAPGRIRADGPRDEVAAVDLCYWRQERGALCSRGRAKQYWCEYCHEPRTDGEPERCRWRVVGEC